MTPQELAEFDRALHLQIDLLRHATSVEGAVLRILEEMRRQLLEKLAGGDLTVWGRARTNAMLKEASALISRVYVDIARELDQSTAAVPQIVARQSATQLSIALTVAAPSSAALSALASNALVEGAPSAAWWKRQAADTSFRFANIVRQGIAQGESSDVVYRRTGELAGLAGRNSRALVQTSIMQVASDTRMAVIAANTDIYKGYRQLSTLDGHTTPQCIARSNLTWTLDKEPIGHDLPFKQTPIHWGCRSVMLGLMRSPSELGLAFSAPAGLTRASSEGQIDRSTTFDAYLSRRTTAQQDAQLGAGRAQMWREGTITLRELVDAQGNALTLAQLRRLHE